MPTWVKVSNQWSISKSWEIPAPLAPENKYLGKGMKEGRFFCLWIHRWRLNFAVLSQSSKITPSLKGRQSFSFTSSSLRSNLARASYCFATSLLTPLRADQHRLDRNWEGCFCQPRVNLTSRQVRDLSCFPLLAYKAHCSIAIKQSSMNWLQYNQTHPSEFKWTP